MNASSSTGWRSRMPLRAEADQRIQAGGDRIVAVALVRHGEMVLLPRLIEKRRQAMVEDIEEVEHASGLCARIRPADQLRYVIGQRAQRPDQPHEIDVHRGAGVGLLRQRLNGAGGKMQNGVGAEAHHFALGMAVAPHRRPLRAASQPSTRTDWKKSNEYGSAKSAFGALSASATSGFSVPLAGAIVSELSFVVASVQPVD